MPATTAPATLNLSTATRCTCRHLADVCPACYRGRRRKLADHLYQLHSELVETQREIAELEDSQSPPS